VNAQNQVIALNTMMCGATIEGTDVGMPQNVERARSLEFMPRWLRPAPSIVSVIK